MSEEDKRSAQELEEVTRKIRAYRKEKKLSQPALSSLCFISTRQLQRLEKGGTNCSLKTLVGLCMGMHLSLYQLLSTNAAGMPAALTPVTDIEERLLLEKEQLGRRLSALIKQQGLKQGKLAAEIEREDSEISHYVNGHVNLQYVSVVRMAMALKVETVRLFQEEAV